MKILQLIDSLEAGGAEMMAVNYANALHGKISFSGLVTTRKEGSLKEQLYKGVPYLFLERKRTLDFKAVIRLKKFCSSNGVELIHAHSSSYAIACMVKMIHPQIRIVWHDHDGMSEFLHLRKSFILRMASSLFTGIISVNQLLKKWNQDNLRCKNVTYLPNFSGNPIPGSEETLLEGEDGKRILCVANLRPQKNHFMLIEIASAFRQRFPDWSFHLVGKDFNDDYAAKLKQSIVENNLSQYVYIYGSKSDIGNIITQSEIGILTSSSEGLPVALLEYGQYCKPVVATAVGEIPEIVKDGYSGFIAESDDAPGFLEKLSELASDEALRIQFGKTLYAIVMKGNSDHGVIEEYLDWLKSIDNE